MSRPAGFKHSEETKEKIRLSNTGQKRSNEQRRNMSVAKLRSDKARGPNAYQWIPDRQEAARRAKVAKMCYGMVGRAVAAVGSIKESSTFEELGYTPQQLREHLESLFEPGMSWENHGKGPGKWHVDHIRPIVSFPEGTPLGVINALENLRPLWETENLSKGSKWQPKSPVQQL